MNNLELVEFQTTINPEVLSREIIINNQETYTYFGDILKLCKNKIKEIDEERKTYTDPLEKSKKLIIAKAKQIIKPIEEYINKITKEMGNYYLLEEKKRQEEQKRLEEEAIKNAKPEDIDIIVPIVESIKTTHGEVSTTTGIKYNEFEIIDETLIPREYLMVDESKIKTAINKGGVKSIDGIKIIENVRFTNR